MKATEGTVVAIRLITAWATDLAAEGRVQRAEKVLSSLGAEEQGSPEVLDLRARMLAQRKHFAEAEALWKQALRLAPDREDFREALALCGKLRKRPRWMAFPRERTAWLGWASWPRSRWQVECSECGRAPSTLEGDSCDRPG